MIDNFNDSMRLIPLTRGYYALVDAADYEWLSPIPWRLHSKGYAASDVKVDGKWRTTLMHVEVFKRDPRYVLGCKVDHVNNCYRDNRHCNLRVATTAQNGGNRRLSRNNTSGVTGIFQREDGVFVPHIRVNGERIYLPETRDWQKAVDARRAAEKEYFGEFQHDPLNLCPLWHCLCPGCSRRFANLLPPEPIADWEALAE